MGLSNPPVDRDVTFVAVSASGADNTLVGAITNRRIRVHQVALQATASCTIRFESNTGGTALTGQMPIVAGPISETLSGSNGMFCLPYSPVGWFETEVGQLLNLELSTSSVFGVLGYTET